MLPWAFWLLLTISVVLTIQTLLGVPFRREVILDPEKAADRRGFAAIHAIRGNQVPKPYQQIFATITENGRRLPQTTRSWRLIEEKGHGRYRIDGRKLSMSASDNTHPADNGRTYAALLPRKPAFAILAVSWLSTIAVAMAALSAGVKSPRPPCSAENPPPHLHSINTAHPAFRLCIVSLLTIFAWIALLAIPAGGLRPTFGFPPITEWEWKTFALASMSFLVWAALAERKKSTPRPQKKIPTSLFLTLAIGCLVLLRLPEVFSLEACPDESDWIIGAGILKHDPRYWLSFDGVTSGPLVPLPLLLIDSVGFQVNYHTIKAFALMIWIAIVLLSFDGMRLYFGHDRARILILPLIAGISLFCHPDFAAYNGEHMSVLLIAIGITLHARLALNKSRCLVPFALGCSLGLVPLAKLQAVPIALTLATFATLPLVFKRDRRALWLIAGGIAPCLLLVTTLTISGNFQTFYKAYFEYNLAYVEIGANRTSSSHLLETLRFFFYSKWTGGSVYFHIAWFAVILIGTVFLSTHKKSSSPRPSRHLIFLFATLFIAGLYSIYQTYRHFPHYLLLLTLPFVFLIGALFTALDSRPAKHFSRSLAFLILTVILPTIAMSAHWRHWTLSHLPTEKPEPPGIGSGDLAMFLRKHTSPGERIGIWADASRTLVKAELLPAHRTPINSRQVADHPLQAYFREQYLRDLDHHAPRLFLDTSTPFDISNFPELKAYVQQHYQMIDEFEMATLYRRKSP
ncbi:MAG: hypothetical protein AAF591_08035 [Verrucomicrobiota bacterium]